MQLGWKEDAENWPKTIEACVVMVFVHAFKNIWDGGVLGSGFQPPITWMWINQKEICINFFLLHLLGLSQVIGSLNHFVVSQDNRIYHKDLDSSKSTPNLRKRYTSLLLGTSWKISYEIILLLLFSIIFYARIVLLLPSVCFFCHNSTSQLSLHLTNTVCLVESYAVPQ